MLPNTDLAPTGYRPAATNYLNRVAAYKSALALEPKAPPPIGRHSAPPSTPSHAGSVGVPTPRYSPRHGATPSGPQHAAPSKTSAFMTGVGLQLHGAWQQAQTKARPPQRSLEDGLPPL
jgi:hypothetical protein